MVKKQTEVARSVPCPICLAAPGVVCITPGGNRYYQKSHWQREKAAGLGDPENRFRRSLRTRQETLAVNSQELAALRRLTASQSRIIDALHKRIELMRSDGPHIDVDSAGAAE